MLASGGALVENCTASSNDDDGFDVAGTENRLEGSSSSENNIGYDVNGAPNLFIRNTARDSVGNNFEIVSGNRVGTIVAPPTSGELIGDSPSSSGVGTTDPWANFSH